MRRLKKLGRTLRADPRLAWTLASNAARNRLPTPEGMAVTRVGCIRFECDTRLGPAVHAMYHGTYEPEVTLLLRRLLRPGDVFLDIGANLGFLSAVALDCVGPEGTVHAFEPVPSCYERLQRLAQLNPERRFHVHPFALGEAEGTTTMYLSGDGNPGWNTAVLGLMNPDEVASSVHVPLRRLDVFMAASGVDSVALIKIDVEGGEFPVLQGLSGYFSSAAPPPPIVCEVAPSAYPPLRSSLHELARFMAGWDYEPRSIQRPHHLVDLQSLTNTTDILFRHRRA